MNNIRKDLIEKWLERFGGIDKYKYVKLSNKALDKLFNHYKAVEIVESFYDSDPGGYDTYKTYSFKELLPEYPTYKSFDDDALETAYDNYIEAFYKICNAHPEYEQEAEDIRLNLLTWQDVYGPGIWDYTEIQVEQLARHVLKYHRNLKNKEERIYFRKDDENNTIYIYIYARDILGSDWDFVFERNNKKG